jgi:peptidoglycan L-alanyl-D-glutamate endopeptidase CwlK
MLMKHSDLTSHLLAILDTPVSQVKDKIHGIIRLSSGGVNREAGVIGATIVDPPTNQAAPFKPAAPGRFVFGKTSEKELIGVKPELVECVREALELSTQDFMVFDGLRTLEEQKRHVANGTSKTMKSKHLDGLAVDLVPFIDGEPKWDWEGCYEIAMAMDEAATHLGFADNIRWGGAWDRTLADFGGNKKAYAEEVAAYRQRHPGPDFIDGPHFEWVS